jgi:hypothetical protein
VWVELALVKVSAPILVDKLAGGSTTLISFPFRAVVTTIWLIRPAPRVRPQQIAPLSLADSLPAVADSLK